MVTTSISKMSPWRTGHNQPMLAWSAVFQNVKGTFLRTHPPGQVGDFAVGSETFPTAIALGYLTGNSTTSLGGHRRDQ